MRRTLIYVFLNELILFTYTTYIQYVENTRPRSAVLESTFHIAVMPLLQDLAMVGVFLKDIFLIFPSYAIGKALMDVSVNHMLNEFNNLIGEFRNP